MGFLFNTKDEKITKITERIKELTEERRKLVPDMEEFQRGTLEDSKYWDRIAEVEINLSRLREAIQDSPTNVEELKERSRDLTKELIQLTSRALKEDQMYIQMGYEKKIERIDTGIEKLEKKLEEMEAT